MVQEPNFSIKPFNYCLESYLSRFILNYGKFTEEMETVPSQIL